jgi:hypothetical protein
MKDWIRLWARRVFTAAFWLIGFGAFAITMHFAGRVSIRFLHRLLPERYAHWIEVSVPFVLFILVLLSLLFLSRARYLPRYRLGRSLHLKMDLSPLAEWNAKSASRKADEKIEIELISRIELAQEEEAQYVNLDFLETTETPHRSLGIHEGLYTNLVYKLVVSLGLTPDLRFSAEKQEPIEHPKMEELALDVVLALPVNVDIIGSPWAVLRWPIAGPSIINAEFEIRSPLVSEANLKVLIFYEHDLLFCADLKLDVKVEGFKWPSDGRPIRWVTLDKSDTFELSLFRRFRDLDRDCRRRLNISVHRRVRNEYELLFFLRSANGSPAVYPLRFDVSNNEIELFLAKIRSAFKLLVEDSNFSKVSTEAAEYSGRYVSHAEGTTPEEAMAYDLIQKLLQDMAVVGHELWGKLFGSALGQTMADKLREELKEEGVTIQVWISNEAQDFILPWVWLYAPEIGRGARGLDKKGFWGYRYVIEQVRHRSGSTRPPSTIAAEPLRVSGALHNFTTTGRQRQFFDSYKRKYLTFNWEEIRPDDLNAALRNFGAQILYLYCHGHTEKALDRNYLDTLATWGRLAAAADKEDAALMLEFTNTLKRKKIRDHSYIQIEDATLKMGDLRLFRPSYSALQPLVFLNMCESAEFYPGATDNLVDVFLEHGAGGVIGTEIPMMTVFGDLMARRFFELYLSADPDSDGTEGQAIGRVLWLLRRQFLDDDNPLAFAYTHYGDATTKLKPAIRGRDVKAESAWPSIVSH